MTRSHRAPALLALTLLLSVTATAACSLGNDIVGLGLADTDGAEVGSDGAGGDDLGLDARDDVDPGDGPDPTPDTPTVEDTGATTDAPPLPDTTADDPPEPDEPDGPPPCRRGLLYADNDGDGWGAGPGVDVCLGTPGYVAQAGDCNDGDAFFHPGQADLCNGRDEDCDGMAEEDDDRCRGAVEIYNNHVYYFALNPGDWFTALGTCEFFNAHLVKIEDQAKDQWLRQRLIDRRMSYSWIGANDQLVEGVYTWVDASPVNYAGWAGGEPSRSEYQDCCWIEPTRGWGDYSCRDYFNGFICEADRSIHSSL